MSRKRTRDSMQCAYCFTTYGVFVINNDLRHATVCRVCNGKIGGPAVAFKYPWFGQFAQIKTLRFT